MGHEAGLAAPTTESVLISPRGDAALVSVAAVSAADQLRNRMRDLDGDEVVSQARPNPDRSALLVSVQLSRDQEDATALQDVTASVQADHPDLQVRQAGDLSVDAGIN